MSEYLIKWNGQSRRAPLYLFVECMGKGLIPNIQSSLQPSSSVLTKTHLLKSAHCRWWEPNIETSVTQRIQVCASLSLWLVVWLSSFRRLVISRPPPQKQWKRHTVCVFGFWNAFCTTSCSTCKRQYNDAARPVIAARVSFSYRERGGKVRASHSHSTAFNYLLCLLSGANGFVSAKEARGHSISPLALGD